MVRHQKDNFPPGLTLIVNDADTPAAPNASAAQTGSAAAPSMMLDFGIIALDGGGQWSDASGRERALLLISGSVRFEWDGCTREARRASCFDENPEALQIPAGMPVKLTAGENGAELAYEACINPAAFEPVYYSKDDIRADVFGAGVMNEASIRTVRTVFDGENAEFSQMVLGEVINHPGKWSSYPPPRSSASRNLPLPALPSNRLRHFRARRRREKNQQPKHKPHSTQHNPFAGRRRRIRHVLHLDDPAPPRQPLAALHPLLPPRAPMAPGSQPKNLARAPFQGLNMNMLILTAAPPRRYSHFRESV